MKSTVEVLREARALIDTPEKWTRETYGTGNCFCADGAVHAAAHGCHEDGWPRLTPRSPDERRPRVAAQYALRDAIGADDINGIHDFNDSDETTHADVLAAFDRAIEAVAA